MVSSRRRGGGREWAGKLVRVKVLVLRTMQAMGER